MTANHDVRPPGWAGRLSADFDTPFRADRIRQRLTSGGPFDAVGLGAIQGDLTDLYALELIRRLGAPELDGDALLAFEALTAWDGRRELTGPAALFQRFERELAAVLFRDEEEAYGVPGFSFFFRRPQLLRALDGDLAPSWWDDLDTPETEDRAAALQLALGRAWRALATDGPPAEADFGRRHQLRLEHPLGSAPLIGGWFDRGPFPMPGSATTVNAFGGGWTGDGVAVSYGPSLRFVADPADWDRSLIVLPGGQAGHPADPHYDDQFEAYLEGRLRALPWTEAAVEAATVSRFRLLP